MRAPQARTRETRERIFQAAIAHSEKQGLDRTSMAQIARQAGVASGTLYHHFPDKRALLIALSEEQADRIALGEPSDLRIANLTADPRTFLLGLLQRVYARLRDRNRIDIELLVAAQRDEELRRSVHELRNAGIERLALIIEFGQQQGLLRAQPDPAKAALLLSNAFEQLAAHLHLLRPSQQEADGLFDELTDMICRYLLEDD